MCRQWSVGCSPLAGVEGITAALVLAGLPALGNVIGGLLTTVVSISPAPLGIALHGAAGVLIAVLCVELIPTALNASLPLIIIGALLVGGVTFLVVDAAADIVQRRLGRRQSSTSAVFAAVAIDLFIDGLMIGSGTTVTTRLGLLLALGQVPADIPEGFASIASLVARGVSPTARVTRSLVFAVPILAGTTIGYFAVRSAPDVVKLSVLALAAGMLLTVVMEELVPEAHTGGESRWAVLALLGGFCLFALLSTTVG